MKKSIILLIIGTISFSVGFSQNLEQNLKKYWYSRDRLKSDFMVVDNNNGQGTNIPAGRRYEKEEGGVMKTELKWGDAVGYLGMYIAVLATEYQILFYYSANLQVHHVEMNKKSHRFLILYYRLTRYFKCIYHSAITFCKKIVPQHFPFNFVFSHKIQKQINE